MNSFTPGWSRHFFALVACVFVFSAVSCTDPEKKMDAVERAGKVVYNGKVFPVSRVERKNEVVYIIEKDGVAAPVPLENVEPAE